jgi:nitric oxide reductase large subunit
MRWAIVAVLMAALCGCVGAVVSKVVTAPVKVVSKTADVLTTSQDEADRNRGRKARKAEND